MEQVFEQYPNSKELALYSGSDIIQGIELITKQIDVLRPLSKETENKIMQKLRLDWNYNSNAIEGNSLDYGETVAFLMHGVTAKGKPLKDYLDIKGHNEAINYLVELIAHNEDISEKDIRAIHKMILVEPYRSSAQTITGEQVYKTIELGKYKSMPNHVKTVTGEIYYYATPEETPILMSELIDWYRSTQELSNVHPVVIASIFHHKFVSIHPFDDGNGRMARLLMNMILMKHHYPPVIIKKESKDQYYFSLSQADSGKIESFIGYISERLLDTTRLYLKGAKGESIEESNDLDKKLLLFKKEIESRQDRVEIKKSEEAKNKIIDNSIEPLINSCILLTSKFKDLFINSKEYLLSFEEREDTGLSWIYNQIDIGEVFIQKRLHSELIINNDLIAFCFQFNDFKVKSKSFSVEIKVLISFYDLDYRIGYTITHSGQLLGFSSFAPYQWIDGFSLQKFYHQDLSVDEIEKFTSEIGERMFDYVQDLYSNDEKTHNIFTKQDVEIKWEEFINEDITEEIKDSFYELNSVDIENNIITIDIATDNVNVFNEKSEEVEEKFYNYIKYDSRFNTNILVQIV